MELREQRALHIAATTALAPDRGRWKVPSQSGNGNYVCLVTADGSWTCSCPDFEERLAPCKHVMAIEITMRRETKSKGGEFSETVKITYSQNWKAYNGAQCNEKRLFMKLLADLCSGIEQPEQTGGRPRLPLADVVLSHIYKCYIGRSARRFTSDLTEAADKGIIDSPMSYNSILRYGKDADLTPILAALVEQSSLPLTNVETEFAIDSTGFGTSNLRTWFSTKHGREITSREWCKLHAMVGVRTHIVTAVNVTGPNVNDAPQLPALTDATARNFTMRDVSADKGYSSKANAAAIEAVGATPFIAFKHNTVTPPEGTAWSRMYHYFAFKRDEYLDHYHQRSNVETAFMMIKAKFGENLLTKTETAQTNEVLGKVICHNICCLIQAMYELGIDPKFN